ncbi:MAG: hypothetical protein ACRCTA_02985, partial [Bacilli bacterium]
MKYYNRAWLSIIRQQGKFTILLLSCVFLGVGIILSFLIRNGIETTKQSMEENINLSVVITGDTSSNPEPILKELEQFSESPYVKSYQEIKDYFGSIEGVKRYFINSENAQKESQFDQMLSFVGSNKSNIAVVDSGVAKVVEGQLIDETMIKNNEKVIVLSKQFM